MNSPTYEEIAAALDAYVAKRVADPLSVEAHITRSTVAICKLEEAARYIALLLDEDRCRVHRSGAADFVQRLTSGAR